METLDIKELVKQHFNLVDAVETKDIETEVTEAFATIKTKDGELEMEYDELAAGKPIFLITEDGKVPGPTGMYVLENDKSVRIEDGIIAEVKEVADMEEEEEVVETKKDDKEEMAKTKEEMDERTDAEEEGYKDGIKDAKEDIREAIDKIGLTLGS